MATRLYFRDAETTGVLDYRDATRAAGTSAVTGVRNTATGTGQLQWTRVAGADTIIWVSPAVAQEITVSGQITVSTWVQESDPAANCGWRMRLYVRDSAGTETHFAFGDDTTELDTAASERTLSITPTSTVFPVGSRLVLRPYVIQAGGTRAAGFTCTMTFDGAAGATGDSFVELTENLVFTSDFTTVTLGAAVAASLLREAIPATAALDGKTQATLTRTAALDAQVTVATLTRTVSLDGKRRTTLTPTAAIAGKVQRTGLTRTVGLNATPSAVATKVFLRDGKPSEIDVYRDLSVSAGAAAVTGVVNTAAAAAQVQFTKTAGGEALVFATAPVDRTITLAGALSASLWARQSDLAANCGLRVRFYVRTVDGAETHFAVGDDSVELTTTDSERVIAATPAAPTVVPRGARIIMRPYIIPVGGTMAAGHTATLTYGAANAATGDSFLTFSESFGFNPTKPSALVAAASPNTAITIPPGEWVDAFDITTAGLTINAYGVRIHDKVVFDVAAVRVSAARVTLNGIEIDHTTSSILEGRCIYVHAGGADFTLRDAHLHDSQGFLMSTANEVTNGKVRLINCTLEDPTYQTDGHLLGHCIYIGEQARCEIYGCTIRGPILGSAFKNRARELLIEASTIAGLDEDTGRVVDIAESGSVVSIRGSVIEMGALANVDAIGLCPEHSVWSQTGVAIISHNIIVCDKTGTFEGVRIYPEWSVNGGGTVSITNNRFVKQNAAQTVNVAAGESQFAAVSGSIIFNDRTAAGIGAYPALPEPPGGYGLVDLDAFVGTALPSFSKSVTVAGLKQKTMQADVSIAGLLQATRPAQVLVDGNVLHIAITLTTAADGALVRRVPLGLGLDGHAAGTVRQAVGLDAAPERAATEIALPLDGFMVRRPEAALALDAVFAFAAASEIVLDGAVEGRGLGRAVALDAAPLAPVWSRAVPRRDVVWTRVQRVEA